MGATGVLMKQAKEMGLTTEELLEIVTTNHKTLQGMSNALQCQHATVLYWLRMYGYKKDSETGRWIKQSKTSREPQNAA